MTVFFTADTHLGHKNIITSTNRPFKSVAAMDGAIVKRWNERVTPQDRVYHLGDFAFDDHDPYLELLNGQKHLILGNHDDSDRVKRATRWQGIRELKEIKLGSPRSCCATTPCAPGTARTRARCSCMGIVTADRAAIRNHSMSASTAGPYVLNVLLGLPAALRRSIGTACSAARRARSSLGSRGFCLPRLGAKPS